MFEPSETTLLVLLAELHRARKTGLLRVSRGETRLVIELRHGDIAGLEPPPSPRAAASDADEDEELAALLSEAYLGPEPGLQRAAARQTLLEALAWRDVASVFEEGPPAEGEDPPLGLSTDELLREAAHSISDPEVVEAALGDLDRPLQLLVDPLALGNVALTPTEGYLLSRVDGRLTAREVVQLVPLDATETERSLFGLLLAGLVDYAAGPVGVPERGPRAAPPPGAPASPPQEPGVPEPVFDPIAQKAIEARRYEIIEAHSRLLLKRNHFEVLGLTRDATDAEVKTAYFRLAKRFHPDAHADPVLADLAGRLQAVFSRLGEAYDVLSDPELRARYEELLPTRRQAPPKVWSPPRVQAPLPAPGSRPGSPPGSRPDSRPGPPPGSHPEAARPTAAYDTSVSSFSEPRTMGEDEANQVADDSIQRAEQLLAEEKYWDVIQALEAARDYIHGRSRKSKARLLLARAYIQNPSWVKKGEEILRQTMREDPENAEACFLLGAIYKKGGLQARATSMFRKVLELKPGHKEALEALGESSSPTLLKRLFGRA